MFDAQVSGHNVCKQAVFSNVFTVERDAGAVHAPLHASACVRVVALRVERRGGEPRRSAAHADTDTIGPPARRPPAGLPNASAHCSHIDYAVDAIRRAFVQTQSRVCDRCARMRHDLLAHLQQRRILYALLVVATAHCATRRGATRRSPVSADWTASRSRGNGFDAAAAAAGASLATVSRTSFVMHRIA